MAPVSITCSHSRISIMVPAALLGPRVLHGELTLGSGCGVTAADGDGFRLEHPLVGCGTRMELLPDTIHYSNILHYSPMAMGPVAHTRPFSLPVHCYYPRMGSISSGPIQPTWVPFGSSIAHRRHLRFALDAYDRTWSSRLPQPSYALGELMNVEASLSTGLILPIRVLMEQCEATLGAGPWYKVIDKGCLLDGQLGRSRFLPQHGHRSLRFQLDTSLFPTASSSQIHLRCHLRAVAEGTGSSMGRACSYDPISHSWHSLHGADCSCCASPSGCRTRLRRFTTGPVLLGEANIHLGPLELLPALPSSSLLPTAFPMAPEPSPHSPSVPIVRGENRDSGLALPIPGTTLAMVAMSSILAAVAITGCYCSMRRHWGENRRGGPEAAPRDPGAMVLAPPIAMGTPGTPPAHGEPLVVSASLV
ncbi:oocyte-secreted protein 3 [Melopsittacus undulatus]|uniref:oocyte-secreted protein 3 n=1 Tax=Melopsittacus undulatus TaxID=13146 RepID=UPI00146E538F|nr:zona pellucida sperm-binding protein 3-like [Melopsittacus undulatus]